MESIAEDYASSIFIYTMHISLRVDIEVLICTLHGLGMLMTFPIIKHIHVLFAMGAQS